MPIVTKMCSYDLQGKKLSFADWISNLSPTETPFASMIGKEAISQTKFEWQTDVIPTVSPSNAQIEGSLPGFQEVHGTTVLHNTTQIFRRAVSVSDTANVVAYYGRGKEIGYQMEKAGLELKRDIEVTLLGEGKSKPASTADAPTTSGFVDLCLAKGTPDADSGVNLHFATGKANELPEAKLFEMTENLYMANSKANVIMFHPKWASQFTSLIEVAAPVAGVAENRMKMFGSMDDTYNAEVDTIIDPLGQKFALVPNRHMPEKFVYFFNPADWTQMILRAPKKIQLAKMGSSEEWMVETELGLRHRNKAASGILEFAAN
ncbi:MAG: SU10 major capsid protein [Fusobacteriaceae bacterium]